MNSSPPSTAQLARNTILTILGQGLPLIIGVVTIPYVVRELGDDRFGLLSFVWVLLGYFTIFDFGLGRATTKFVAEELGKGGQEALPRVVWTAVLIQVLLGIVGTLIILAFTPLLVMDVLSIPPDLHEEARQIFYLVSFVIPVILISGSFRGVLEAAQRFDAVSGVRLVFGSLNFLFPAVGILAGFGLVEIVALLMLSWFGMSIVLLVLNMRFIPQLRAFALDRKIASQLFSFGGWVMITSIAAPMYSYVERFTIAAVLSVGVLTYYAVPFEMISRLAILPASIATTLFPAFSYYGIEEREKVRRLISKPLLYLLFALGPVIVVCIVFAFDILRLWLGEEFATQSVGVFQVLSAAMLFHAFAHIPFAAVHGLGRPDLKAKFDLVMMVAFAGLCLWLVPTYGILGAAYAKCILMVSDFTFLSVTTKRLSGLSWQEIFGTRTVRALVAVSCFAACAVVLEMLSLALWVNVVALSGLTIAYVLLCLSFVMDEQDRSLFLSLTKSFGLKAGNV